MEETKITYLLGFINQLSLAEQKYLIMSQSIGYKHMEFIPNRKPHWGC